MIVTRRRILGTGGGLLAALVLRPATGTELIELRMRGNEDGSRVWFDPIGIHVEPGATLRWTNGDAGNSHTVTAYHPDMLGRPRRIPKAARPWNSDYLLPDEAFSITLTEEGVYDYYCIPHEHAGMVGRIVVGQPKEGQEESLAGDGADGELPEVALAAFPSVEEIMRLGLVRAS